MYQREFHACTIIIMLMVLCGIERSSIVFQQEDEEFTELGVLSSDPNRPVYVYFVEGGSGVVAIFETFNKSAPPSSVFDIPPNCKSQEGRKEPAKKHQDRKGFFKL